MLKKALKKQGITAKVTKSGVTFEIPLSVDFRRVKLPPIGKPMGKKEHTNSSTTDVIETDVIETDIKRNFLKFMFSLNCSSSHPICDANSSFSDI